MRRIAVVGASAAGLSAAETLRREGYDGTITLVGEEPEPPYDRPPLSKQVLAAEWERDRLALRTSADLAALDLDLRLGVAATGLELVSRTVELGDGSEVPYDGLIIATGVRPRRLPGEGAHVLRTLDDALTLRERLSAGQRLVVVGAGFLGAEAAAVAWRLGAEVTVLEPAAVPLAHAVGAEVGRMLAQVHVDRGIDLRCGVTVTEVTEDGVRSPVARRSRRTRCSWPSARCPTPSGWRAAGSWWATGWCATSTARPRRTYAAGDVARWYNPLFGTSMRIEHRTNAAEQGMAAARNLLAAEGARKPFAPVPYFWSDQYDMKIQAYGFLRGHDEVAVVEGDLAQRRFVAGYRTGGRVSGALAVGMPPKAIRRWRQAIATGAAWHETVRTGVPAADV